MAFIKYGKRKPKCEYNGDKFASKAEMDFAKHMRSRSIPYEYESDKFPWQPPLKKYTPDFKVYRKDMSYFYVEYKGYLRPPDRTKMKAFKEQHPDVDLRMVFMNASKPLYKGSPTSYAVWSEKMGFPWAEKTIPAAWLRETVKETT